LIYLSSPILLPLKLFFLCLPVRAASCRKKNGDALRFPCYSVADHAAAPNYIYYSLSGDQAAFLASLFSFFLSPFPFPPFSFFPPSFLWSTTQSLPGLLVPLPTIFQISILPRRERRAANPVRCLSANGTGSVGYQGTVVHTDGWLPYFLQKFC